MPITLLSAVSNYGKSATAKLANVSADGEPEDQLRAPLETLFADLAELCGFARADFAAVGESAIVALKTRPDYAVTLRSALVGFVEIKAPGKGANPDKFRDKHDKQQWDKLKSLPNLIYTDGNEFSLWRSGELALPLVSLVGDVETSGAKLAAPDSLVALFDAYLRWEPIPPKTAKELASVAARLCKLLRAEVTEQLDAGSEALTALANDWRNLLFPEADNVQFADGYAQAVTFGLLMARARDIELKDGLDRAAKQLGKSNSLIGAALRILTENAEDQNTLKTSLGTLTRVLDAVNWHAISKDRPEAWLYFYEEFLEVYDNALRKETGSYYTPPEVVEAMVRLVDDVLVRDFGLRLGLASPTVKVADPALGTGTFLLEVLRRIAATFEAESGGGAVPALVEASLERLIGFEMQLGPFAVAQLRIQAELLALIGRPPQGELRLYVTDTLGDPHVEQGYLPHTVEPIAASRRKANDIKKAERITVVIGNPPYKNAAKGRGGWIEDGSATTSQVAPLDAWKPPPDWGVGAHVKHLSNLYVYFWRWATWKVFDQHPAENTGVVCFITVAGFLNGPGFQRMRDYLRRTADRVWVIDCSPEGHQPDVPTRVFQGVQQPVCIVMVSRSKAKDAEQPAEVRYAALPVGPREKKFVALSRLTLTDEAWQTCPTGWRESFLPVALGAWPTYPVLEDLFAYNGCGVQPKRTWVIAPDAQSLIQRWQKLIAAPPEKKEDLFHATLRDGKPADRHIRSIVAENLPGFEPCLTPIIKEKGPCVQPIGYGYRSFNRQWIIPDPRVITQPNANLWRAHSAKQVYLTAFTQHSPTSGPSITFTGLMPDLHHYKGSFGGRAFPLWRDKAATEPNLPPKLLAFLSKKYKTAIAPEDFLAYLAAVAAHPAYTAKFQAELTQPGLRIPITAKAKLFAEAVELGRTVIWLHTFGERFADADAGRAVGPPRLPADTRPFVPKDGAIPSDPDAMPDELIYDATKLRLHVGGGHIDRVPPAVWNYEVSGKQVLKQWFSYRKKDRDRPVMGDRRPPSKLCDIQPDHWLPEYTTELLNLIQVLALLVELEPRQAKLLEAICAGPTITADDLRAAKALDATEDQRKGLGKKVPDLFADVPES